MVLNLKIIMKFPVYKKTHKRTNKQQTNNMWSEKPAWPSCEQMWITFKKVCFVSICVKIDCGFGEEDRQAGNVTNGQTDRRQAIRKDNLTFQLRRAIKK